MEATVASPTGPLQPSQPTPGHEIDPSQSQAMQGVMAQLPQLGISDPAAQEEMMAELREVDPELWPLAIHTRRAMEAYRQRAGQRASSADNGRPANAATASTSSSSTRSPQQHVGQPAASPVSPASHLEEGANPMFAPRKSGPSPAAAGPERLPVAEDVALVPGSPPKADYPETGRPAAVLQVAAPAPPSDPSQATSNRVVGASYEPEAGGNWQVGLAASIAALERDVRQLELREAELGRAPAVQHDEVRRIQDTLSSKYAQLKILYLLAGRRDDAVRPIPAIAPAEAEFWSKQMHGLDIWLDAQQTPDAMRRAAEAKQELDEAVGLLGEAASLVVHRLAFGTKIDSYGCFQEFKKDEFSPGQEVLLYAEVENITPVSTNKGFHTSLQSSYEIFNRLGQRVDFHDFTNTEEYCRNRRRDFFIGYHLRLPEQILPGEYTLTLTIEDLKSRKVGQSSIVFSVKQSKSS